jgi:valyl-tRNA synthetase
MRISEDKVKGYKHFANKLWNIARFVLENTKDVDMNASLVASDAETLSAFETLTGEVTADIEEYRIHLAAEKIYHYAWHEFADKILEESKPILAGSDASAKESRSVLLLLLLTRVLKLLHPFMPFVTEEIYQSLPTKDSEFLMIAAWPVLE